MKNKSTKKKRVSNFPIINLNAAGIDIADKRIDVCVPSDRDDDFIRTFGTFTCDLNDIADYLRKCNIDTVAMESTGVYWVPLFLILQEKGMRNMGKRGNYNPHLSTPNKIAIKIPLLLLNQIANNRLNIIN